MPRKNSSKKVTRQQLPNNRAVANQTPATPPHSQSGRYVVATDFKQGRDGKLTPAVAKRLPVISIAASVYEESHQRFVGQVNSYEEYAVTETRCMIAAQSPD